MPSLHRRAALGLLVAGGVAGCTDRLSLASGDDEDISPADRTISPPEPGGGEWIRSTRSVANDTVAPAAAPPREDPEERWRATDLDASVSVVVADGTVFAGSRDVVQAHRLEDGDRLWTDDEGGVDITVVDGRCYTFGSGTIVARDAETGEEHWRHESAGDLGARDLVEFDGTVYYTTDGDLYGLHADTGDHRWTVEGEHYQSYLAIDDDELHWALSESYRVLEPNGPMRPEERTVVSFDNDVPSHPSPPAVVDETIGLGAWRSRVTDGPASIRTLSIRGTVWQRPFEPAVPTPAILEDRLLVTGYDNSTRSLDEATVAALDRETGDPIWEETVSEPVGPAAVADGVCYVGGGHPGESVDTGRLFALEVETGELLWDRETDGASAAHPLALVDDAVVLGTREGVVVLE